jgi:hypothetical protein
LKVERKDGKQDGDQMSDITTREIRKLIRQALMEGHEPMIDDQGKIHDDGHEVSMAESDLYKLAEYAPDVYGMVDNYADLPGWVQKKITLAAEYIGSVKHYLEHEHFKAKNKLGDFEHGDDL